MPVEAMLTAAARIVGAVDVPVSIDFEGGYAVDPAATAANFAKLAATGAVGANFEDQVVGGEGLHPAAFQAERIAAVRAAVGADFFINARTDIFLKARAEDHDKAKVDAAIERAHAYADAGASGFFAPGLAEPSLVERLTQGGAPAGQSDGLAGLSRAARPGRRPASRGSATGPIRTAPRWRLTPADCRRPRAKATKWLLIGLMRYS